MTSPLNVATPFSRARFSKPWKIAPKPVSVGEIHTKFDKKQHQNHINPLDRSKIQKFKKKFNFEKSEKVCNEYPPRCFKWIQSMVLFQSVSSVFGKILEHEMFQVKVWTLNMNPILEDIQICEKRTTHANYLFEGVITLFLWD